MLKSLFSVLAGPPGLILVGAILGAIGALWAAQQQTEFERELRRKNEEIAELNRKTLYSVTGGDSFCYVSVFRTGNVGRLVFVHQGEHTLYDVTARIVNLDRFDEVKGQLTLESLNYTDTNLTLGTLIAGHSTMRGQIDLSKFPQKRFNIFFAARNGSFHESLRLVHVDNTWKQAIRVFRGNEIVLEKIDDGYPRNTDGQIEW